MLFLLGGCGGGKCPQIAVKSVHCIQMPADGARIPAPRGVSVDSKGNVVVIDKAGRLTVFGPQWMILRQWRMPEFSAGTPENIAVLRNGNIAVADTHYHRVVIFSGTGEVVRVQGSQGTGAGQFLYPVSVTEDDSSNLYVCEYGSNDRVQKFGPDGTLITVFGSFGTDPGQFQRPSGMAWHRGNLYVADAINNRIQVFSDTGTFLKILGTPGEDLGLQFPYDITIGNEKIYVMEWAAGRISMVGLDGKLLGRFGSTGPGEGQFNTPWGLDFAPGIGLIVADTGNRRIVEVRL
jgi:DNA-binding beta-propeller fold protein YncE